MGLGGVHSDSLQRCHLGLNINHSIDSSGYFERLYLSVLAPLPTGRLYSQCRVSDIDLNFIIIVTEQVILVIGIHPPFHITESDFQFTDLPFNMVDHIGRRNWVRFIPIYFPLDLPKPGLFSRTQIFAIIIRKNTIQTYDYKRLSPWQLWVFPCLHLFLVGLLKHRGLVHGLLFLRVHFQRKLQRYYGQGVSYPHIS